MNVETYLAMALLNMGWDCAHCVNEKREYNINTYRDWETDRKSVV